MTLDRIILGDNQFFGVSHMSEERGMERAQRFQEKESIIALLDAAYECGIRAYSFSTHDGVRDLCSHFRRNSARYDGLAIYPVLPYAQKYAHSINERGIFGALNDLLLSDNTASGVVKMLVRGSTALLTRNPLKVMRLAVDAEMRMFHGLRCPVVFLQNNVADLMLGFGLRDVFKAFADHVRDSFGALPGFMTLNLPRMADMLNDCGIDDGVACAAINRIGFQMNPSREAYESVLQDGKITAMAMSIMAAGALKPRDAIGYVGRFRSIESLLIGASTPRHLEEAKAAIEDIDGERAIQAGDLA